MCKIVESIRVARGWVHSDSEGYIPDTISHLPTARSSREGPEPMATRGETSGGNPRRSQSVTESPTLLQIPLCVTVGPPEDGDPSLHWPALVDPAHNLDRREDSKGARPKVEPRFSTQTISEEAQGFQGGTDFYLPLIGQPRISEVHAWRTPVCTEQGKSWNIYVSLRLCVQNAVPAQPCVGKIRISLVLFNFLHCNFRLCFETP